MPARASPRKDNTRNAPFEIDPNENDKSKRVVRKWTNEEDSLMMDLVMEHGTKHWGLIGARLNGRTGKQCRERWHNQLDPSIRKDPWTHEEEDTLLKAHAVAKISLELITSREEVSRLRAKVKAAEMVAQEHDREMIQVRDIVEVEKNARIRIDNQLHETVATLEASIRAQRDLEQEVSRLRGEIIMTGAEVGSQTMQMKAQPQRRRRRGTETLPSRQLHPPTTSSSPQYVETSAWTDQLALEASVSQTPLAEPNSNWRSGNTNSLGQATQAHRASPDWMSHNNEQEQHCYHKDMEVIHQNSGATLKNILARPEGQESRPGLHSISKRRHNRQGTSGGNHRVSISAEANKTSSFGCENDYKGGREAQVQAKSSYNTQHEVIHQGSLFVGSGLGLRKEQEKKTSMSSREMLKNILANRITTTGSVEGSV